ncbi:MAG TPA: hypothetical protein VLG50_01655 [Candidatus Saccharimonadales bacterium]|nr:hypothetical protein [Candidatus Saccharimonadales bacterium]
MLLLDYLKEIELQNPIIESHGNVEKFFLEKNILTLWDAIKYVHELPYGRTTNRENYFQILDEKKGACSTKHALIASLAQKLFIPLKLTLGLFLLTPKNTPQIATILKHYHLEAIPEAHCYLKYNNNTLDITFPGASEFSFNADLEQEINITPEQIGVFKVEKHHAFIEAWVKNKADINFDLIWAAREEWIEKLSKGVC